MKRWLNWLLDRPQHHHEITAMLDAARYIRMQVEKLNIPVIADDVDAGYDMAIDEVISLIEDYEELVRKSVT